MSNFNWTCPHCNIAQTVVDSKYHSQAEHLVVGEPHNSGHSIYWAAVSCCNPECEKITVIISLFEDYINHGYQLNGDPIVSIRLFPRGNAKPQPDFIPLPLREDYYEACLIRDDSPKASATLSRRCLQGMIRHFCKITKATLAQEIEALRKAVDDGNAPAGVTHESVEAIDHVRGVGNIGAHMEKDIDLIIPVDPDEAQILIDLIESLFDEWYVAAEKRRHRFANVATLAAEKKALIAAQKVLPNPNAP